MANFILAVTKLAQTNLRNVIGDMSLDNALTSRDNVNVALREVLDDATDKWGVKVVRVEIQRIDPPMDVMDAMHEQMKAERNRRAVVLEAERLDLTEFDRGRRLGHRHVVTQTWERLEDLFVGMGYTVAEGPEIEDEWHNFGALNFPPDHPKMPGEPPRVQPSKKVAEHWDEDGNRLT